MIEVRKITEKEKNKYVNAAYVIELDNGKSYLTEKALKELFRKINEILAKDIVDNINDIYKLEYENGLSAGEIAKKYNITVGELGCKHCGVTIHGAINENECMSCGNKLIE
jgi:hypothetical protein